MTFRNIAHRILIPIISLLCFGCQTMPSPSTKAQGYQHKIAQADAFYKDAIKSQSPSKLRSAAELYQLALKDSPSSVSLQYKTYNSYYSLLVLGNWHYFNRAHNLYSKLPNIVRKGVAPPSYAKLLSLLYSGNKNNALREKLIFNAIKEAPQNPTAHQQLAFYRAENYQYLSAIAFLKQAARLAPDNKGTQVELGFAYSDYLNSQECPYTERAILQKAIQHLQANPDNQNKNHYVHSELASLYSKMGLRPLQLREAQKAYDIKKNDHTTYWLISAFFITNKADDAFTLLREANIKETADNLIDFIELFAQHGYWQNASEYSQQSNSTSNIKKVYEAITLDLVKFQNGKFKDGYNLNQYQQRIERLNISDWQLAIHQFWLDKNTGKDLINRASNRCESAEAQFYVGLKHYFNKDYGTAKKHFKAVLTTKVFGFIEYGFAKQLIKEMEQRHLSQH